MTRSELRTLRLRLIDGYTLTDEQALAIVSALEEVAVVVERETGTLAPENLDPFITRLSRQCPMQHAGERCPNEPCVSGVRLALRDAGPVP